MTEVAHSTAPLGIYTHIEKTAGTSVRKRLESTIGTANLYLYSCCTKQFVQAKYGRPETSALLDKVRLGLAYPILQPIYMRIYSKAFDCATRRISEHGSASIPREASVVFGHFRADQFDPDIRCRPTVRAVTIREPLSRLRSHYDHWKRTRGKSDWSIQIPYDSAMSFESFAMLPQLRNFQMRALGKMSIRDFDVIGITENIEESVAYFFRLLLQEQILSFLSPKAFQLAYYNRTPQSRRTDTAFISANTLASLRKFHSDDYDLYAEARELSTREARC